MRNVNNGDELFSGGEIPTQKSYSCCLGHVGSPDIQSMTIGEHYKILVIKSHQVLNLFVCKV